VVSTGMITFPTKAPMHLHSLSPSSAFWCQPCTAVCTHSQFLCTNHMYNSAQVWSTSPLFYISTDNWKRQVQGQNWSRSQMKKILTCRTVAMENKILQSNSRQRLPQWMLQWLTYSFNKYFLNSFLWQDTRGGCDTPR
jgi:epoxyqueuosine reductase QueG